MNNKRGAALVVGAGIAGVRSALDLAENGYAVTLIDRSPHIGGILSQLDHQFPTDHCGMCRMLPLVDRDAGSQFCLRKGLFHDRINIRLSTELIALDGAPGDYTATIRSRPALVDPDRCIGCGACAEACPVSVPDAFNEGLSTRKAIYLPVPHAIPNPYVIDPVACNRCGECLPVCPTDAIQLISERRQQFRILVVDDESIMRDSLKEWLHEEEGFAVDTAGSGPEALEMLAREPYQLMLLDIKMPGMDGVEVLRRAKADFPELSVVMMTAYADVETAVSAMKIGAIDYLMKPFEPEVLIPQIVGIYGDLDAGPGESLSVGAVVLCGGVDYADPAADKNTLGYGQLANVVTSLEFERMFSGTGPSQGRLVRPRDGKPIRRVAWLQCVGSRDVQCDAEYCSSICCMFAIKEAVLATQKCGNGLEPTIFYMDMRTFGKSWQRYRERAATEYGVRFQRARAHSLVEDEGTGDIVIRYTDFQGHCHEDRFDMAVLSVGQRPAAGTAELAEMLDLPLNPWGFIDTDPFACEKTVHDGIFVGGSYAGLKDIRETVIQAGAAAVSASGVIHGAGGGLAVADTEETSFRDVSREPPRILVALCTCGGTLAEDEVAAVDRRLRADPSVADVFVQTDTCTAAGWEALVQRVADRKPNRVLIGACRPYVYARKLKTLGRDTGLDPVLMDVVDIRGADPVPAPTGAAGDRPARALEMAMVRLKYRNPVRSDGLPVWQRAAVIGGGIAGMSAALAIADHGFEVVLVERSGALGGNLQWLRRTLDGQDTEPLLTSVQERVAQHPKIRTVTDARVAGTFGEVGRFLSTIETDAGEVETVEHGVTILATGGREGVPTSYGYGQSDRVVTHKELETRLADGSLDPASLASVVMIQCVDCREEPKNYCSRVCCPGMLKHALHLKESQPDVNIYVLYRDMMTPGFSEAYYTRARQAGVIFIQYDTDRKPEVSLSADSLQVTVFEPVIERPVAITADLLVLAAGIEPTLPTELADGYGAVLDTDGFFSEADVKWRPVDAMTEGVFACGLALAPGGIAESIATARTAAQRALRILMRNRLPAGRVTAQVRGALCSMCGLCIEACPYGARRLDEELGQAVVNAAMCQGCGACAAVCPNTAAIVDGYTLDSMLAVIDAVV